MKTGRLKLPIRAIAGIVTVSTGIYMGSTISRGLQYYAEGLVRNREDASSKYLAAARHHQAIGDGDAAFWNLQMAVANAVDNSQKSRAALAMAEFLLEKAEHEPMPYALMGRQYCEAVLDIETDGEVRYRACRVMVEFASLLKDPDIMDRCLKEGVSNAPGRGEAAEFMLRKINVLLDAGRLDDLKACMEDIDAYFDVEGVKNQVVFLRNRLLRVLDEDGEAAGKWFGEKDLMVRQSKLTQFAEMVERDLEVIIDSGSIKDSAEALYQLACLKLQTEDFNESQALLERFLMTESSTHQADVLMHMARIARHEGKVGRAERMLDVFVKRFSWNKVAVEEFLIVVKEMVNRQRFNDAISLADKYIEAGLGGELQVQLLHFAARTALDAGLKDKAIHYFKRLYDLSTDDSLRIESLLARGKICKEAGAYDKAISLMLEYLVTYPYEAKRGDTYFDVFEMESRTGGISPATLISIASAAALEKPDDPRTKKVLLDMAAMLEKMGLYEMARDRYGRIALLHYVSPQSQGSISVAEGSTVYAAMLGSGRCYFKMGELVQADSVFRDLCNSMPPSAIRSEAAYYWAKIALQNGQVPEARRRLSLMGEDVDQELAAFKVLYESLIAVKDKGFDLQICNDLSAASEGLDDSQKKELWSLFSVELMDEMEQAEDVQGMEAFFDWASDEQRSAIFPMRQIHTRTAAIIIKNSGVDQYGAFLARTRKLISADADYENVMNVFSDIVKNIDELKLSRDAVL